MYTADSARRGNWDELDERIEAAVRGGGYGRASIRIYHDDSFRHDIRWELEKRGFKNVGNADFTLKGDVTFEWDT